MKIATYTVSGKRVTGEKFMSNELDRENLIEFIKKNFSEKAANKVEQWNDVFEGREAVESYIDEENGFCILSNAMW